MINFKEEKPEAKLLCPDGTEYTADPANDLSWYGVTKYKCNHKFFVANGYIEEYLLADEE